MELEWWVSVGWFTVINIMMLCMCMCVCVPVSGGLSVVRCVVCMAGWLLLGVFVCLPICLCFCNYVCVCIYSVFTCVYDKCVFYSATQKQVSATSACVCFLCFPMFSCWCGSYFRLVCIRALELLPKPVCLYWTQKFFSAQYWHMPRKTFVLCDGLVN